jgi:hypothetical protein
MSILENFIKGLNEEKSKELLNKLLAYYFNPSFGAVKQREFDIYLFYLVKYYDLFENKEPTIFEVISKLQITRSKAKSLIYESNLRFNKDKLDDRVKEELRRASFLKMDGSMIALDIEDPLLLDYLKDKLKKLGHSSDTSYSNQILKITSNAYILLLEEYLDEDVKNKIIEELKKHQLIKDNSFKNAVKLILEGLINKFLGSASNKLIEEYIAPLFDNANEKISDIIKKIVKNIKEVNDEKTS